MWYQLQVLNAKQDEIELLGESLEETGALSVMFTDKNDDPVLEPERGTTPLWPEVIIDALYDQEEEAQAALNQLVLQYPLLRCEINVLPEKDWERAWMDDFKPMCFGQRLWICPTWTSPPHPEAANLILDPGLAFGTGTHPTTHLCLEWLDKTSLKEKTLLDYGCGSGILALAAYKLGAMQIYAVDNDPQALQATQNNALNNHVPEAHLTISDPESLQKPVDIIIANILYNPLLDLKNRFHALLKKEGMLVLSGILKEQAPLLIEAYASHFTQQEFEVREDWCLISFKPVGGPNISAP